MRATLAALVLPCLVAGQGEIGSPISRLSGVEEDAMSPISSFDNKDVTFSLYMRCTSPNECFTAGGSGVFNRIGLREAIGRVYNTHAQRRRTELLRSLATSQPNIDWTNYVNGIYFLLGDQFEDSNPTIYNTIRFDRLLVSTDRDTTRFDTYAIQVGDRPKSVHDPLFWDVFFRVTLVGVPEVIANTWREALPELQEDLFGGTTVFIMDSFWVSTDATFIGDQLEPVVGLGHKSQKRLIPLIMGVCGMLMFPALIVFVLVSVAKSRKEAEAKVMTKDKEISNLQRDVTEKEGLLSTYHDREEEVAGHISEGKKAADQRDEFELEERDMDWLIKKRDEKGRSGEMDY